MSATLMSCGHVAEPVCGECHEQLRQAAKEVADNARATQLSKEELGDVLFACRQIRRKCERQLNDKRLSPEIQQANLTRLERLRSAIPKLTKLPTEGRE